MPHLYCLTQELYEEMQGLSKSLVFPDKILHGPVISFPEQVQVHVVNEFDYLCKSIRAVLDSGVNPFNSEFVIRRFCSFDPENGISSSYIDLKNKPSPTDCGHWRYTYATVLTSGVYVSQYKYSGMYRDGKYVNVNMNPNGTDEYYSVSDIVASSSKDLLGLAIPLDANMFSAGHVRYIIPVGLL